MFQDYYLPEDPFAGVTEDSLTEARRRCQTMLKRYGDSLNTFKWLLARADPSNPSYEPDAIDEIVDTWEKTHFGLHQKVRLNELYAIERGCAGKETGVTINRGGESEHYETAHHAAVGLAFVGLNSTGWVDPRQTLEHELEYMKESVNRMPVVDTRQLITRLSGEWASACDWIATRVQADPDGPAGHYQWRADGQVVSESMQAAAWRMATYLHGRKDHTATFDDLKVPVYDDPEHIADADTFGSLRRAANNYFNEHGIPLRVAIRKGRISLNEK